MLYENYIDRMKNYHDLKESIGIDGGKFKWQYTIP